MPNRKESLAANLLETFNSYAAYKSSTWEQYFRLCDKFYAGFRKARNWPGTKKARSDMKLHVSSDFVETLYSSLAYTLFFSGGENFFDVVSTNTERARMITERIRFILHGPYDASGRTSMWGLLRTLRMILKYGIGFASIDYDHNLKRPTTSPISPYDLYWSSSTKEWVDDSPYLFQFTRTPVPMLEQWRHLPGYTIPAAKKLMALATDQISTDPMLDAKEAAAQAMTGQDVGRDTVYSGAKFLDLIRVTSRDTIYWLLPTTRDAGAEVIYEGPNRLQAQPYVSSTYRPLLRSLGGVSPVGMLSTEHELQQVLINSVLDFFELVVSPPRQKGGGTQKQAEWVPGAEIENTNEKIKAEPMTLPQIPREVMDMYAESRNRAMRVVGTNEMAVSGRPMPSNANRTLGGIQLQSAAREERQFGVVLELENMLIVPALLKISLMDGAFSTNLPMLEGRGEKNMATQVSSEVMEGMPNVEVRGATRMVGVGRLSSAFRPLIQYLLNPMVIGEMAKAGLKVNMQDINQFANDSFGVGSKYTFYVPMAPEEQQQRQQMSMQADQAKGQQQAQIQSGHDQTRLAVEQLKQEGLSEDRAIEMLEMIAEMLQNQGAQ